jgi:hypothetical protein
MVSFSSAPWNFAPGFTFKSWKLSKKDSSLFWRRLEFVVRVTLTLYFSSSAAQENCASVWLFPCTWQSSGEVSVSVETTELENLHVESKGAHEESIHVDVIHSEVQEVSQASISLVEVNSSEL